MIDDKFGVTLILPECAFSAEVQRNTLNVMMEDIDAKLTAQGVPDEPQMRCDLMIDNMLMISTMVANHQIDPDAGITDLAYCFIYTFAKSIGFEQIELLRGLTGSYIRNQFRSNPCLNEIDYQQEAGFLSQKMNDHQNDDEWDFDVTRTPTLH